MNYAKAFAILTSLCLPLMILGCADANQTLTQPAVFNMGVLAPDVAAMDRAEATRRTKAPAFDTETANGTPALSRKGVAAWIDATSVAELRKNATIRRGHRALDVCRGATAPSS